MFWGGVMLNIACIGYLHGSGGAERQIIMLANEMNRRGHKVSLIVLAENNVRYNVDNDINVYDLTGCEHGSLKIIKRYFALRKLLCTLRPDITINFWLQSAYFSVAMPTDYTGKIIYSERGDPGDKEYNGVLGIIRKISFQYIDGFVFQSNGARDYFDYAVRTRSIVINNAVTDEVFLFSQPANLRKKKIVTVGRLSEQKNQKLLLDAFSYISKDFPEYVLEIWGEGPLHKELLSRAVSLGIEDKVLFKGTSRNILHEIYDASVFVLSSNYEGMPNALMEAMCIGIPCVSTDCRPGGAREIIKNGIDGYIVPIENSLALSQAIKIIIQDCNEQDKISKAGWENRKQFSGCTIYDRWENFLYQLFN